MDTEKLRSFIDNRFDEDAIPKIMDYIRIPNLSRNYDKEWNTNGLLEKAAIFIKDWIEA